MLNALGADLGATLGCYLIACVFNLVLWAVVGMQTLDYFKFFPKDIPLNKVIVGSLMALATFQAGCFVEMIWTNVIDGFGDLNRWNNTRWTWQSEPVVSSIISLICQAFFLNRCWIVTRSIIVVTIGLLGMVTSLAFGIGATWSLSQHTLFTEAQAQSSVITASGWLASFTATDVFISACLVGHIWRKRRSSKNALFASTDALLSSIMSYAMKTAALTSAWNVVNLGLYLGQPTTFVWSVFQFNVAKVYTICVLYTLLSRIDVRRIMAAHSIQNTSSNERSGGHNAGQSIHIRTEVERDYELDDKPVPSMLDTPSVNRNDSSSTRYSSSGRDVELGGMGMGKFPQDSLSLVSAHLSHLSNLPLTSPKVPSIHCPSCVYTIKSTLSSHVRNISVNLLAKSVTFECDDKKAARKNVVRALQEIGYSVESPAPHYGTFSSPAKGKGRADDKLLNSRHLESCDECREKEEGDSAGSDDRYITKLSIDGMTCSSCTQTLSSALKEFPGIDRDSVRVNLMAAEAEFTHSATLSLDAVREEIDTIGYDSEVIASAPLKSEDEHAVVTKLEIEGMTCISCSRSITDALMAEKGVISVDVSVTGASAVVEHIKSLAVKHLVDTIEDIGFVATAISTESKEDRKSNERSVELRVDGMFCGHCPSHLLDTLNWLPLLSHTNDISLDHPFVTLTYSPNAPSLTIRSLMRDIAQAHPRFSLHIVENTATSSRSTAIHLSEAKAWLARVAVSALFSIAALVVNVVGMMLLDENHHLRRELERAVWGQATVGMLVMFALATPMYFVVGWVFHKKSYLSLKASTRAISKSNTFPWKALVTWGSMDLLITIGTSVAYFASIAMLIIDVNLSSPEERLMGYFEMPVFLIFFISVGRAIESYMKAKTGDAISALGKLKPNKALLVTDEPIDQSRESIKDLNDSHVDDNDTTPLLPNGEEPQTQDNIEEVRLSLVEIGDKLLVQGGESVPIDGVICNEGSFPFDMSSVTGESLPVTLHKGDEVLAGTTTMKGFYMRVTSTASETLIDRIIRVVNEAQSKKAPIEKIADAVTAVFVPVIVLISLITLIAWLIVAVNAPELGGKTDIGGKVFFAIQFAISAVVIACPCGIGLAVPTVVSVSGGIAARIGVLVQSGNESFELANKVQIVVFDKTGTLTKGELAIVGETKLNRDESVLVSDQVLWDIVVKLEEQSSHPIAKAVRSYGLSKERTATELLTPEEVSGRGVKGLFKSSDREFEMRVGNGKFVGMAQSDQVDEWKSRGNSIVYVAVKESSASDGTLQVTHALAITDSPRDESREVVAHLRSTGKQVYMLTGDEELTARSIAQQVGISAECVISGVMPDEKVKHIERLREEAKSKPVAPSALSRVKRLVGMKRTGEKEKDKDKEVTPLVMFVGDGLNDAGAVIAADVGCAQGTGSQITLTSAHFILLNSSLRSLINVFRLSRLVKTRILINFVWACVFNVVLIPIAAGVFYPLGVTLPPVYSALAMALSSVSVVTSSLLLRLHRFQN
ncbi:hypothetical protein E3P99_03381 [Wallemia hederae]|uniref:HMA domain-containing protein n=1 Tax=Wallemia hederae TaxID=1540922 RepID=A0A4V4LT98_9BASI|nr:hypothetical protein E3P99_03381 [Wallemia hederae]